MRKALILFTLFLLAPAFSHAGVTVSYSDDGDKVCPANSFLIGSICQCSLGYVAKNNACVKPDTAPVQTPTQYQIYQDILMSVTVNDGLTCAQLGWVSGTDLDMCSRYLGTPADKRLQWVGIPRPYAAPSTAILNPWAPPSQQTMTESTASTTVTPKIVPKPVATTTPEKPDDAALAKKALEDIAAAPVAKAPVEKPKEDPAPAPMPAPEPAPEPELKPVLPIQDDAPAQPNPVPTETPVDDASSTIATTTDPITIDDLSGGLVPFAQVAPAAAASAPAVSDQETPPPFFARIFKWLFGWL
jgi:hypothetical protein